MKHYTHKCIGLMSGSSLDGVDIVHCSFHYENDMLKAWSLDSSGFFELDAELKHRIRNYKSLDAQSLKSLDIDLGRFFGQCILEHAGDTLEDVDVIGVHGQTIYHLPEQQLTCQLGDGTTIQTIVRQPVVCDFRSRDLQAGGVGTPMAPLADDHLFPEYDVYLNLGGIANVSFKDESSQWIAFDVCPFNQYVNYWAAKMDQPFDEDGKLGAEGQVQEELIAKMSSYPYFKKQAPKSLDNNWIVEQFIPDAEKLGYSVQDSLASFYTFASVSICTALDKTLFNNGGKMLATGGGAYNSFFMEELRKRLGSLGIELVIPEKRIIDYKEAMLIALAASFRLNGKPNFYSSVTGARESVCGGVLYN